MKELKGTKEEDKTPPAWFTSYMEKVGRDSLESKNVRQNLHYAPLSAELLTPNKIAFIIQFCLLPFHSFSPECHF